MLIPSAVVVATVLLVWHCTRRTGPARTPELGQQLAVTPACAAG